MVLDGKDVPGAGELAGQALVFFALAQDIAVMVLVVSIVMVQVRRSVLCAMAEVIRTVMNAVEMDIYIVSSAME